MADRPKEKAARTRRSRAENQRVRPDVPFRRCPPLHGSATHHTLTRAEADLAQSIADELNQAAVVAASEPDGCYPAGSAAALMKCLLDRQNQRSRERARRRALDLLACPPDERRAYLGEGSIGTLRGRAAQPIASPARRALIREVARERVHTFRTEVRSTYDYAASGALPAFPVCPAQLEGVISTQVNEFYTTLTITEPEILDFRWNTDCEDAEIGIWEVRRLPSKTVVASGSVNRNTSFSIDFGQFLADGAPPTPQLHEVRIRPHHPPRFEKIPGMTPGSSTTVKVPAKPAGSYSNKVFVAYARDETDPQVFASTTVYRRLSLHIDHFEMVEQQGGLGADEYWLHAAVVEREGAGPPDKNHLLTRKFTLDGAPAIAPIDYSRSIKLEYPSSSRWPKEQVLIMTVLEEDGGEDIAEAMGDVWNWLSGWLSVEAFDEISEFLEEIGLDPLAAGGISAGLIAAALALAGSVVGAIGGAVLSALAGVILIIEGATADDYFGTKVVQFRLPTNDREFVQQALAGTTLPGGTYRCDPHFVEFHEWTMPSINAYDGFVEVKVHWELTKPEELLE